MTNKSLVIRPPVRPETAGNDAQNMMEIWHICLFSVIREVF